MSAAVTRFLARVTASTLLREKKPSMFTPVHVVRDFYDHLARGDFAAILSLMAEDIEWTEAERFP
jgi:hypothetical protein